MKPEERTKLALPGTAAFPNLNFEGKEELCSRVAAAELDLTR